MSKEFQRIKERQSVRTQLSEFIGTSIPRAVSASTPRSTILHRSPLFRRSTFNVSSTYVRFAFSPHSFKRTRSVDFFSLSFDLPMTHLFSRSQLIGSSLLFVHDGTQASLWMIDFGKTRLLPADIHITHAKAWIRGSHEDGYLIGLDNLILLFQEIIDELKLSLVTH